MSFFLKYVCVLRGEGGMPLFNSIHKELATDIVLRNVRGNGLLFSY